MSILRALTPSDTCISRTCPLHFFSRCSSHALRFSHHLLGNESKSLTLSFSDISSCSSLPTTKGDRPTLPRRNHLPIQCIELNNVVQPIVVVPSTHDVHLLCFRHCSVLDSFGLLSDWLFVAILFVFVEPGAYELKNVITY